VSRDEAREMITTGKFSSPALKIWYEEKVNEQKIVWSLCQAIATSNHEDLKVC
jgi:hypothetical protein